MNIMVRKEAERLGTAGTEPEADAEIEFEENERRAKRIGLET
jgi:hypothetical protein